MSDMCMACRTVVSNNWIQCPKCKCVRCVPTTEKSSVVDIPIESRKPPFQSEPFPGYIGSLKARIAELEHAFKRVQHILGPDYMITQATGIPLPEDRLFAIYEIVEEVIGGNK